MRRIDDATRYTIVRSYVRNTLGSGARALSRQFHVSVSTIQRIVAEAAAQDRLAQTHQAERQAERRRRPAPNTGQHVALRVTVI
jgi:hypothetical protein